ncbi:hypothetical protein PY32053_04615 (plasmid) [Paracoccus yeei]|uniref:Uncharacterized protein n=1 Tax=Paracoccus yeei TaxID=147645 RepID=A0A386UVC1_9RHOB|nr:hypothetical protein PY32053_04615 [Paracoccus yeei]
MYSCLHGAGGRSCSTSAITASRNSGLGREVRPSRGGHRQACDIGDDSAEATMAQPLFHKGQHRHIVAHLNIDHPVRWRPGLLQPRREQIRLGHAPQHLAGQPRRDGKAAAAAPSTAPLPPPATSCRQPSSIPPCGSRRSSEGQHAARGAAIAFHPLDLRAQGGEGGMGRQSRGRAREKQICSFFVLIYPDMSTRAAERPKDILSAARCYAGIRGVRPGPGGRPICNLYNPTTGAQNTGTIAGNVTMWRAIDLS